MNLAYRDIRHNLGRFLLTCVGLGLLLGVVLAKLLGLHPAMGLLAGSITLSGGHGTGAAWGKVFAERFRSAPSPETAALADSLRGEVAAPTPPVPARSARNVATGSAAPHPG